jgi:hypothetical protein
MFTKWKIIGSSSCKRPQAISTNFRNFSHFQPSSKPISLNFYSTFHRSCTFKPISFRSFCNQKEVKIPSQPNNAKDKEEEVDDPLGLLEEDSVVMQVSVNRCFSYKILEII